MIEPSEFLTVARKLSAPGTGEAEHRTAISRAYYAAYHEAAQKYAIRKNLPLSDSLFENHQKFIHELRSQKTSSVARTIGNQLQSLKKDRVLADYKLKASVTASSALKSCTASQAIIEGSQNI